MNARNYEYVSLDAARWCYFIEGLFRAIFYVPTDRARGVRGSAISALSESLDISGS